MFIISEQKQYLNNLHENRPENYHRKRYSPFNSLLVKRQFCSTRVTGQNFHPFVEVHSNQSLSSPSNHNCFKNDYFKKS
jgi:hypothetical protein